jgi:hypothetical protein
MNTKDDAELTKATRELARSIANLSNMLATGLKTEPEKEKQPRASSSSGAKQ